MNDRARPRNGHTNYRARRAHLGHARSRDRNDCPARGPTSSSSASTKARRVERATRDGPPTARHYQPIGGRVTLANRCSCCRTRSATRRSTYSAKCQTTQKSQDGLGGASSVRGIAQGPVRRQGNRSSRTTSCAGAPRTSRLIGRQSSLVLSGFVDAGRVWATESTLSSTLRRSARRLRRRRAARRSGRASSSRSTSATRRSRRRRSTSGSDICSEPPAGWRTARTA